MKIAVFVMLSLVLVGRCHTPSQVKSDLSIESLEMYVMYRFDDLDGTSLITPSTFPMQKQSIMGRSRVAFEGDTNVNDTVITYYYNLINDTTVISDVVKLLSSKIQCDCQAASIKMALVLTASDMTQTAFYFDENRLLHENSICYSLDMELFKRVVQTLPPEMKRTWLAGL